MVLICSCLNNLFEELKKKKKKKTINLEAKRQIKKSMIEITSLHVENNI